MLGEIRSYLKKRGTASLSEVAIHFDMSEAAAKMAIEYWIKKHKVQAQAAACGSSCGGCTSGDDNYQWLETTNTVKWYKVT